MRWNGTGELAAEAESASASAAGDDDVGAETVGGRKISSVTGTFGGERLDGASVAALGEPSPRADAGDTMSSTMRKTVQSTRPSGRSERELELEFEVDRYYLCEALLKTSEKSSTGSGFASASRMTITPSRGLKAKKQEPPPVTAAYYVCNFGHIALGQTAKEQIVVYNCCTESVTITIDKKMLKEKGFLVEPENMKPLAAGKQVTMTVSATSSREDEEGAVELEWNLPVKGGPNYKIQLYADFVLPDLILSSESIDFGRVIVGQKKRAVLELKNEKAVPVTWYYSPGQKKGASENPFDLQPSKGTLQPGKTERVTAIFAPKTATAMSSTLNFRLCDKDTDKEKVTYGKKVVTCAGRGEMLRLEVRPELSYNLGPVMPSRDGCSQEFVLHNPTDYAIEVYSVDFDKKYLAEERVLQEFDGFNKKQNEPKDGHAILYEGEVDSSKAEVELPVRLPGDDTWRKVARRVDRLRWEKERERQLAALEEGQVMERIQKRQRLSLRWMSSPRQMRTSPSQRTQTWMPLVARGASRLLTASTP
jgi:hydrocephalus-inducing protein